MSSTTQESQLIWNKVVGKGFVPSSRDGHCCAAVGRKLYAFGGVTFATGELTETNDLLMFNLDTSSWTRIKAQGEVPSPRSAACMASVGNLLYLFGGSTQDEGWTNSLFVFNTDSQTWASVREAAGTPPSPRDKMTATAVGQKIYVFGGFGPKNSSADNDEEASSESDDELADLAQAQQAAKFGWFDDLFVYDTVGKSWTQPMLMNVVTPTPRAAHATCAIDKSLVVFGGRDAVGRQNDLYLFDIEARKWSHVVSVGGVVPESRSFHTATSVGRKVVVFGGRGTTNQHFNDLHVFDIDSRKWSLIQATGDIPEGRGLHTAALVDDSLVVFAGSADFNEQTMSSERYFGDTFIIHTKELNERSE